MQVQNETAGEAFLRYGYVYKELPAAKLDSLLCRSMVIPARRSLQSFLRFDCDVCLEIQQGTGILLVSADPRSESIEEFGLNQRVHILPGVCFAFIATTPELAVDVYAHPAHNPETVTLATPYEFQPVLPHIQIQEILGYYYRLRTPGYRFKGEQHQFYELTYVDTGILHTEVDGVSYTLRDKEMILYGPGQFHSQDTDADQSVSYVTILFRMDRPAGADSTWHQTLLNRVYPYNKKTYTLIKTLVQESSGAAPYRDSLMLCLLTEIVIRLLQSQYVVPTSNPASVAKQNYRDELFEQILAYVESRIYEPITIAEICEEFSISRSSLQLLFKNEVDQSPKKYISDLKLEKSRQMLRENRYTVSEVSLKLGYSSIHYFSNAFTQKYHISPSEYAKRIY